MRKLGKTIYIHRSDIDSLSEDHFELVWSRWRKLVESKYVKSLADFNIIKIKKDKVSFIKSEDFDFADEPTVGDSYVVNSDGSVKYLKKKDNPPIYRNKWAFVPEDYCGFDVEQSKKRSKELSEKLANINIDKRTISHKKQWLELLEKYDLL